jgi:hypothetical protein
MASRSVFLMASTSSAVFGVGAPLRVTIVDALRPLEARVRRDNGG